MWSSQWKEDCGDKRRCSTITSRTWVYKGRNVVERCFCRLKDFRRIATHYDKLARNFLAAVLLAAIVAYWIN